MKFVQLLPEFVSNALAALAVREVADVGLRNTHLFSDVTLAEPATNEVFDDVFPHTYTIANASSVCNSVG